MWDGFAYDPDLKLVYFGTANAAAYDQRQVGPGASRCPLHRIDPRRPRRQRRPCLVLPDGTRRPLGLRRRQKLILADLKIDGAAHHGDHAGEQERILLRLRPRDREAALGQELHIRELGLRYRHEDRTPALHQETPIGIQGRRTYSRPGPAATPGRPRRSIRRRAWSTSRDRRPERLGGPWCTTAAG